VRKGQCEGTPPMLHRVYFTPGMFGFGRLASYDYFAHLEAALGGRFRDAGQGFESHVVDVLPTASLRRRAATLFDLVSRTCGADVDAGGPIHVVGHSTGGLDARLVASPGARLPLRTAGRSWLPRLRSMTTINTPHFGTPLASFFATVNGQHVLYSLSALTVIALTLGSPPLAAASALAVAIGRLDRALGARLLHRTTDSILGALDDARSGEVRAFLEAIEHDQGAVLQLTPEAMDLFQAGVQDRDGVRYQCVATMAPPPTPLRWIRSLRRPWTAISSSVFSTLYELTAHGSETYPCAGAGADARTEEALLRAFGRSPGVHANDGVVTLRSQLWGELVWAGQGDHLDVLGHFDAPRSGHVDWLTSGSNFDQRRFDAMVDAVANGMLR
jgi:triacylglycerol lipase